MRLRTDEGKWFDSEWAGYVCISPDHQQWIYYTQHGVFVHESWDEERQTGFRKIISEDDARATLLTLLKRPGLKPEIEEVLSEWFPDDVAELFLPEDEI